LPQSSHARCRFCKRELSFPFYWLKWEPPASKEWLSWSEKPEFGCRTCIEESDIFDYYKYQRNSVLLVEKLAHPKMPSENLGKNLQPEEISNSSAHNFKCDGCGKKHFELGEPRYLCLGCKVSHSEKKAADLVNLCAGCLDKDVHKKKKVLKALQKFGHKAWHPFVRILFNTEGYYLY
jgi:hypothetical protein